MVALETGTQWLADYHNLLARHGLDGNALLSNALTPANREQPALFSLAQLLANPDLLQLQVREDYPDADHPRLRKARLSVLHQSLALQIIGPLVIRLFRDGGSVALNPKRVFLCREPVSYTHLTLPTKRIV